MGWKRVEMAAISATLHFCSGAKTKHWVMELSGVAAGEQSVVIAIKREISRGRRVLRKRPLRYPKSQGKPLVEEGCDDVRESLYSRIVSRYKIKSESSLEKRLVRQIKYIEKNSKSAAICEKGLLT